MGFRPVNIVRVYILMFLSFPNFSANDDDEGGEGGGDDDADNDGVCPTRL